MPWKGEPDPYRIWLSEIILQQTRVDQGLAYYEKFITGFPTIRHLANAPEKEIFKYWEGLGYYSRCRNLIATAKKIVDRIQWQISLPHILKYLHCLVLVHILLQPLLHLHSVCHMQ